MKLNFLQLIENNEDLVGAVGIELSNKPTKPHAFTVLPTADGSNWSQLEPDRKINIVHRERVVAAIFEQLHTILVDADVKRFVSGVGQTAGPPGYDETY